MAAKETVRYGLECKDCGQKGEVTVTENNHPYMTNIGLSVKSVDGEFSATKHGDSEIAVTCLKCQASYVF